MSDYVFNAELGRSQLGGLTLASPATPVAAPLTLTGTAVVVWYYDILTEPQYDGVTEFDWDVILEYPTPIQPPPQYVNITFYPYGQMDGFEIVGEIDFSPIDTWFTPVII